MAAEQKTINRNGLSDRSLLAIRSLILYNACLSAFSQMFADVRRFSHPSESVGVNRLESVGGVWAGIAKRNNKRRVASDVPRSFSHVISDCTYMSKNQKTQIT